MTKIIVNGYKGKMGIEAVKAIESDPALELVGKTDIEDNLAEEIKKCNASIVVDLTHPKSIFKNVKTILNAHAHAVVGTTGLTESQLEECQNIAKKNKKACLICPNFAIGAILMMRFAKEAASFFDRCEIIEYHHDKKADAPSGTAIKTAQLITENNQSINSKMLTETELIKGSRGGAVNNIPIHSLRLPGVIANQEVILGTQGQTLTMKHDTISREAFMPGLILAIKATHAHIGLVYGLEKIL